VLVENFRTGAMERLGFGYEAVVAAEDRDGPCDLNRNANWKLSVVSGPRNHLRTWFRLRQQRPQLVLPPLQPQ
jgi:hypothetical protein